MSYTEVFGGETIAPTQLSYIAYESNIDVALTWPLLAPPDANVAADKIDVEMTAGSLALIMPPADQISVGQDVLVRNVGSNTFSVTNFDGTEIGSVASGEAWYFVVIDNETEAGEWYAIEFGAGTSSATAASLAGAGLRAAANRLDQNLPTTEINGAYAITIADRATVLQSGGGTITWTFASAATLTEGWFTYVINAGTGSITLTAAGGETIDGSATKVIAPTESLIMFSDGANLHSLGYGRSIVNTITTVSINVAGSGTLALTNIQVRAQVQDYVGTMTGARIVEYGADPGYWFVFNNTTGAFSLTLRTDSLDAGAVVPQGTYSIIRSNGTNMDVAFTTSMGTVTQIDTGAGLTGGPITATGTISMLDTTVIASSYGAADRVATFTVNSRGQLTAAAQPLISIPISQVQVMTSADLAGRISDETGTGQLVFAQAPAIGEPTTITLTNGAGLPLTGIIGFGAGVATFLATPSSANLATAVTDETGTGALVFANTPTLVNPVVGTQAAFNNSTTAASTAYADRVGVQQIVFDQDGAQVATAGNGILADNSIPQQTEGDQILSLAITPKSATSTLIIEVNAFLARAAGTDYIVMALFQDATANALSASVNFVFSEGGFQNLKCIMTSGTTSATTFKVRVGSNTPAVLTTNGTAGTDMMGGVMATNITITEVGS